MNDLEYTPPPWEVVRSVTCGHLRAAHNYQSDPRKEFSDEDIAAINAVPFMVGALAAWELCETLPANSAAKQRAFAEFIRLKNLAIAKAKGESL